jgi:hypothetical protein
LRHHKPLEPNYSGTAKSHASQILGTASFLIATLSHPLTDSELSKIYLLATMRLAQKHLNSLKYFNR